MTNKNQLKKMQVELEDLYDELPEGTGLLDTVRRIVEIEILLELESNQ